MSSLLDWLVDPSGLTPHGFCLSWEPGLIWLHAVSDVMIGLAYFSIPLVLARFAMKRPDFGMNRVLWLFSIFIMACGTTHFLAVLTLWVPAYGLEGLVKAATAAVSVVTAVLLWPLLPRALLIPAPATLQRLNAALRQEGEAREAAVAQLRESEARYRTLYNETPAAMHTLDAAGRLVGANDEWLRLLCYAPAEVLGRRIEEVLDETGADAVRRDWTQLAAQPLSRNIEQRFRRADGSKLDALVSMRRQEDPSDGTVRLLCVVTDISDRKRAEAALHQAQKMEAIGRLTGGLAHDFNNMLTAIRGSLELLQPKVAQDARASRLVGTAMQASARAAGLTAQLLSFARKQQLEPRALAPGDVVAGMADLLSHTAGTRVALRIEVAPGQRASCVADPNQLESALLNLVVNARNAIAETGAITVRVSDVTVTAPQVDPDGIDERVEEGEYVRIAVTDTGAGMTEQVRRQAFDPFFTTRQPGEGSGLGLSQIQGFVHQSGGHVRIESRPGLGTTVEILLPASRAAPEAAAAADEDEAPRAKPGERVLLVDDEAAVRAVTAEMLRGLGYAVLEAPDAEAALASLAGGEAVTALLTDVTMPGALNGVALAREAERLHPGLGVVLLSGFSQLPDRSSWAAAWRYLAKPYATGTLARVVREVIERRPAATVASAPAAVSATGPARG